MGSVVAVDADGWAELCTNSFVPLAVDSVAPGFRGSIAQNAMSDVLRSTHVTSAGARLRRTAKALRHSVDSDYLFVIQRGGRGRVEQDGRQVELHAGDAVVYDTSRPYTLDFPDPSMEELVLQLPRTLVGHGEVDSKRITARIISDSIGLRVVTAMLTELANGDSAEGFDSIGWSLTELVKSLLDDRPSRLSSDRVASFESITQFARRALALPELTPGYLADQHNVSLRYLYVLFAENGTTPADYIRRERLNLAQSMLTLPSSRQSTVASIAHRCGFTDTTTFARAFRRRFGCTPVQVQRMMTVPDPILY
ncbi:helix-turn-helix domain-containing protein [Rhodococcus sp. NBC_00294]|uniref:helix-turn-helix domain-containing protein n=1 Tax=Rhodococcus sp. NBC_00294 TaxID=2976004 RepID=UPI002E2E6ED8|nr:helix-turn-helix domain-containing protein [Rhodococcus sp. NBC_00294]